MKLHLNGIGIAISLLVNLTGFSATKHEIDLNKSQIKWKGTKVGGSHTGTVNFKSGVLEIENDKDGKATLPNIKSGTFIADLNTIKNEDLTNKEYNDKLVNHLKSKDFFDIAHWPTAKFEITEAKADSTKKDQMNFKGNLTMRDKTHPVEFPATISRSAEGVWQAEGKLVIDRTKWDLKYNAKGFTLNWQALGDKLIHDEMHIDLSIITQPLSKKES